MPQDTQWIVPEVQEDKGTPPPTLTWVLPVACVVAAVLLALILSFASFKLLSSRKRKASLEVTPVTQIATIQLRNGDMCHQTSESTRPSAPSPTSNPAP